MIETVSGTADVISGATISAGLIKAVSASTLFLRATSSTPALPSSGRRRHHIGERDHQSRLALRKRRRQRRRIGIVNGGVAKIDNGVVDIQGASAENVAFLAGGSGGLDLNGVGSAYTGLVSGFGQNTHQFIDFTAIGSAGATFHYTSTGADSGSSECRAAECLLPST